MSKGKKGICYNCGAKRDPQCFFWLVVNHKGNCWAFMELPSGTVKKGERALAIECCPNCSAEQT